MKHFNFPKEKDHIYQTNLKEITMGILEPNELFFRNLDKLEMKKIREDVKYYLQDDRYLSSINYFKNTKLCDKIEDEEKPKVKINNRLLDGPDIEQNIERNINLSNDDGRHQDFHVSIDKLKFQLMRENIKSISAKQKKWKKKITRCVEPYHGLNFNNTKLKPLMFNHDFKSRIVHKNSHCISINYTKRRNNETSTKIHSVKEKRYLSLL